MSSLRLTSLVAVALALTGCSKEPSLEAQQESSTPLHESNGAATVSARVEPKAPARRLWAGPEVDLSGGPSPDGRMFSFVDWSTGDLGVRNLMTGQNRRITNKGPWEASEDFATESVFSPDGKRIAWSEMRKGALPSAALFD